MEGKGFLNRFCSILRIGIQGILLCDRMAEMLVNVGTWKGYLVCEFWVAELVPFFVHLLISSTLYISASTPYCSRKITPFFRIHAESVQSGPDW